MAASDAVTLAADNFLVTSEITSDYSITACAVKGEEMTKKS